MKISSQEEYGIRCLVQVARNGTGSPLPISEIALLEGLSVEYVGKLLMKLRRGGLVESVRGKSGGYVLARPADEITMRDAIDVLSENNFEPHDCGRFTGNEKQCVHTGECDIRPVWSLVTRFLSAALDQVTLGHILEGHHRAHRHIKQKLPVIAEQIAEGERTGD